MLASVGNYPTFAASMEIEPPSIPSTGNDRSSESCLAASMYGKGRKWSGVGIDKIASCPSLS